ncbi:SitI3 family protein [Muricoccus radiodurans]|uniref:SitI3 family protein n=1 Tax=Muricoccus radiodurans TaxID=2231721 RepID=UPI003CF58060
MGLWYDLYLEWPRGLEAAEALIDSAFPGRVPGGGGFEPHGCGIALRPAAEGLDWRPLFGGGFQPSLRATFDIRRFLPDGPFVADGPPEVVRRGADTALRASLVLLGASEGDGVFLFYGETPLLLRRGGWVVVSEGPFWDARRLGWVPWPFERAPLPTL